MDIFQQISQNFQNTAVFEAYRYKRSSRSGPQGAVLKDHIVSTHVKLENIFFWKLYVFKINMSENELQRVTTSDNECHFG